MGLKCTSLSKCLDKKTLLWGFEMVDLLIIFMMLAILNLIFGQTGQKLLLVWTPPLLTALVFKFGKRGRPENFLLHWIRFQFKAGVYSAFKEPSISTAPPQIKKEVAQ